MDTAFVIYHLDLMCEKERLEGQWVYILEWRWGFKGKNTAIQRTTYDILRLKWVYQGRGEG